MTISNTLDLNPEVKGLLTSLDFLGFDTIGGAVRAIVDHSDFAQRWELESLEQQRTLEIWRNRVVYLMAQPQYSFI